MFVGCIAVLFKYCSSVFYHRLHLVKHQTLIGKVERLININISRSYRTIPAIVASVIAGMRPLRSDVLTRSIRWLIDHNFEVSEWFDVLPYKRAIDDENRIRRHKYVKRK